MANGFILNGQSNKKSGQALFELLKTVETAKKTPPKTVPKQAQSVQHEGDQSKILPKSKFNHS
jgi:hypothetical protein